MVYKHLDGRKILISSKDGETISHGKVKTVKELGMPFYEQPHKFGNLYLLFSVQFPEKLDQTEKETIIKVLESQKSSLENSIEEVNEKYYVQDYVKGQENTNVKGGLKEEKK